MIVQVPMKLFLHQIGKNSTTFGESCKKVKTCYIKLNGCQNEKKFRRAHGVSSVFTAVQKAKACKKTYLCVKLW